MRKLVYFSSLLVLTIFYLSCNPEAITKPSEAISTAKPITHVTSKPEWQVEWDKTMEAAKKEGKVVIYSTAGSSVRAIISKKFKDAYGLNAEFVVGRGGELSQKLLIERRAGLYLGDLYFAGFTTIVNTLKPHKMLDPMRPLLIIPEVTDTRFWYENRIPFNDKDEMVIGVRYGPTTPLAINTTLVKENEIKSYQDLLNPRWKGKIIMNDPTIAGTGLRWFAVVANVILNMDYMYQLARQEPVIIRDQQQQVHWLSLGKYAIAIAPKTDAISEFKKAQAPLKDLTPVEGTHSSSGAGNIALINKAPDPQTAKIFMNWFLTREIQYEYSKLVFAQSAREDVPTDHLDKLDIRMPGIKYFMSDNEDFIKKEKEYIEKAREVFGAFIR